MLQEDQDLHPRSPSTVPAPLPEVFFYSDVGNRVFINPGLLLVRSALNLKIQVCQIHRLT